MEVLNDIAEYLAGKGNSNISLLGGETGRAIFFSEYGKGRENSYFKKLGQDLALKIENDLANCSYPVIYSSGLCGILCGLNIIESISIGYNCSIDSSEFADDLLQLVNKNVSTNNYDFFTGSTGLMLFFQICLHKTQLSESLEIIDKAKIIRDNLFYWQSYNKKTFEQDYVNLGIAHGMAALFVVIGKSIVITHNENFNSLLKGIYNYYQQNENSQKYASIFPYGVTKNKQNEFSRLGWCYGDVGIGSSFLIVGKCTGNTDFANYGTRILTSAAVRKDLKVNLVSDPFFCHGTSGLMMIFLNAYKLTGEQVFLESCNFWFEKTLYFLKQEKWQDYPTDLLNGLAGIGLALLSFESHENLMWEKLLLIN